MDYPNDWLVCQKYQANAQETNPSRESSVDSKLVALPFQPGLDDDPLELSRNVRDKNKVGKKMYIELKTLPNLDVRNISSRLRPKRGNRSVKAAPMSASFWYTAAVSVPKTIKFMKCGR